VKNPPALTRLEIRYGDLDPYGHVNNAVYLEFFEKVRICYWRVLADRVGETYGSGTLVAEGSAAHVFFDPLENTVQQRPDWFLRTVAKLEGRPEAAFFPEDH
jgi:acyl-CoA thioesterase FadM